MHRARPTSSKQTTSRRRRGRFFPRSGENEPESPFFEDELRRASSEGQSLPAEVRADVPGAFGGALGAVRIHTDDKAAALSESIGANAFTHGRHIYFSEGQFDPQSAAGKRLLAHELTHVAQQGRGAAPQGQVQRDIAEDQIPTTPVEQIMADEHYFENGIERIEFFTAELAILHYADGTQIRLGLVPEYIDAPFEAVDYRTLRSSHITVSATPNMGVGSIGFLPRGREAQMPPGTTFADVPRLVEQVGRRIRFTHHPNGRIVPTEVNSISAPRLCQILREAEAEYVRHTDEIAAGAVEALQALETVVILRSFLGGPRQAGTTGAAAASAGIIARAQAALARVFARLLSSGATEAVTVEGVSFGGVRVVLRELQLIVTRNTIVNTSRVAGQGRLIHAAFEQAAIQAARQAGARSARVALELVQNPRWAAYLESRGYVLEVIANDVGGFSRVLTKVFTL